MPHRQGWMILALTMGAVFAIALAIGLMTSSSPEAAETAPGATAEPVELSDDRPALGSIGEPAGIPPLSIPKSRSSSSDRAQPSTATTQRQESNQQPQTSAQRQPQPNTTNQSTNQRPTKQTTTRKPAKKPTVVQDSGGGED